MHLFPRFLVRWAEKALARVHLRYRGLVRIVLIAAATAFLAFELSRFWIVSRDYLLPVWQAQFQIFRHMVETGNWLALFFSVLFFTLPFAAFAAVLRRFRRRRA